MARSGTAPTRFSIETAFAAEQLPLGASVACSGVCLTVVERDALGNGRARFVVEVSPETLARTALDTWQTGTAINLELSLKLGDELGGHLVFGHVDGLAIIEAVTVQDGSRRVDISVPESLAPYIAEKGSVALDGISLTVNGVEGNRFWVTIIPHTWSVTTAGAWAGGTNVHVEVDMLARYVARQLGRA